MKSFLRTKPLTPRPIKRAKLMPPSEAKKAKSSKAASRGTMQPVALGEGTLARPDNVLGSEASVLVGASMAEKILVGVILPAEKEKADKPYLDQVVTKFLHILKQVSIHFHLRLFIILLIQGTHINSFVAEVMLESSLAVRSKDIGSDVAFQLA